MSSDKRKFDDFKNFSGNINKDTDNYEFPKLYTEDKFGNKREWKIYVRLIKKESKRSFKSVNWNLSIENQVPIKSEYLNNDNDLPNGLISQLWTESGIVGGEITRSAPTYPIEKNIGRSNYRNYFKQALILARGKYLKKVDEGGQQKGNVSNKITGIKYFPMLAKRYDEYISKHKLNFPVYVQPKLDGMRCIAYLQTNKNPTINDVIIYTRKKKDYPNNEFNDVIRKELLPILKEYYGKQNPDESIYIDGELYNHYVKLQNINHFVRTEALQESVSADKKIQYWIYDIFYPSTAKSMTFKERTKILNKIIPKSYILQKTETLEIKNQKELDKQYNKYIKDDYEGMMIRSSDGFYATSAKGSTGLRSKDLLKRKEVFSEEFEIVGWTQGTSGKEIGAIIWICQTREGKQFNVTPNLDYEERYNIYNECKKKFEDKYSNRMLTIEYRGLSNDKIPQHAKGISFRDE
jgi:ATP-dependent DNA ligase